jgi:2-phosphoglycolate phosphatase
LNQNITAVLFDLDGTLLDTAPDLARSLNTLRQRHQKPPLPIQLIRQVVSHGCPGLIRLGFELGTEHVQYPQLRDDFMALYEGAITAESLPFEGIITVLDALNKQQLPWGIVTNKAEHLARKILTELDLIENCACLIGGDTTPFSKPSPEPLYAACNIIQCSPQACVFIGDSSIDIEAAHRANMPSIAALYGYIPDNDPAKSWGADHYIDKPIELLDWLDKRH